MWFYLAIFSWVQGIPPVKRPLFEMTPFSVPDSRCAHGTIRHTLRVRMREWGWGVMWGCGGGFCCSAPNMGGVRGGGTGGKHTHTQWQWMSRCSSHTTKLTHITHITHTQEHTHTQERTGECCTYPIETYLLKSARTELFHALSFVRELCTLKKRSAHKCISGIIFLVCNCVGQQGSWDINVLELYILGLHAKYFWGSEFQSNLHTKRPILKHFGINLAIISWQKVQTFYSGALSFTWSVAMHYKNQISRYLIHVTYCLCRSCCRNAHCNGYPVHFGCLQRKPIASNCWSTWHR